LASKTKNVRAKPLLTLTYANWQKVRFGDVVREVKDTVDRDTTDLTRFIAGEHMGSEDLHLRTWGDINGDYLGPAFHRIFRKGQVLYGSRRTYLKKVAVASFDGICANTTFVLESRDPDVLLPELLPFVMLTDAFTQHSVRESKGSVNPYINWKDSSCFRRKTSNAASPTSFGQRMRVSRHSALSLRILNRSATRKLSLYFQQKKRG
jgi:hypothetical protein